MSDDTAVLTPQFAAPGSGAGGNVSGDTLTSGIPVVPPEHRSPSAPSPFARPGAPGGPGVPGVPGPGQTPRLPDSPMGTGPGGRVDRFAPSPRHPLPPPVLPRPP